MLLASINESAVNKALLRLLLSLILGYLTNTVLAFVQLGAILNHLPAEIQPFSCGEQKITGQPSNFHIKKNNRCPLAGVFELETAFERSGSRFIEFFTEKSYTGHFIKVIISQHSSTTPTSTMTTIRNMH